MTTSAGYSVLYESNQKGDELEGTRLISMAEDTV